MIFILKKSNVKEFVLSKFVWGFYRIYCGESLCLSGELRFFWAQMASLL